MSLDTDLDQDIREVEVAINNGMEHVNMLRTQMVGLRRWQELLSRPAGLSTEDVKALVEYQLNKRIRR
mgnify:CR=1 FL=1